MERIEFLTVSAFAERAKVSRQALYKQIKSGNSRLEPYINRQGKRVLINVLALGEVYSIDNQETTSNQPLSTDNQPKEQPLTTETDNQETTINQPLTTQLIEQLKAQIVGLQEDKERLNEQVQEKEKIIQAQAEKISSLAEQVADIANRATIIAQQQQILSAVDKKQLPEPGAKRKFLFWQKKR